MRKITPVVNWIWWGGRERGRERERGGERGRERERGRGGERGREGDKWREEGEGERRDGREGNGRVITVITCVWLLETLFLHTHTQGCKVTV